jgi:hypothetical protein
MRTALLCLSLAALAAGACVLDRLGAANAIAQEAPGDRARVVSAETVKDAEVMRRVLVREGLSTRTTAAFVANRNALMGDLMAASHPSASVSEAFVVPGQGVTFILRTSDAVSSANAAEETPEPNEKPTAWDEEAAALEGRAARQYVSRKVEKYEAAKVEALRTRVLDQLAKYGSKIRGLGASESLTVIVQGGGSRLSPQVVSNSEGALSLYYADLAVAGSGAPSARTVLVLRVSVADCRAAADGSLSAEEFRKRAGVAGY